jgi:hypothetical protein
MDESYTKSYLNGTLARWLPSDLRAPRLDCGACARPAKCCAFQPFVPNFLLGGWLSGEERLPEIKNVYFAPVGAIALPEYRAKHTGEAGIDMLCGFYDRGRCRLWKFRPAECSSYFCTEPRTSLRDQGFAAEMAVAQMALAELGLSGREIGEQVDLVNGGAVKNYPGPEMLIMYKKAWSWSQTLKPETVQSWI